MWGGGSCRSSGQWKLATWTTGGTGRGGLLRAFDRLFLRSTLVRLDKISGRVRKIPPEIVVSIETLSEVEVARRPWARQLTA